MYTFPNGKRYIGQTQWTLAERQGIDFRDYRRQPAVWAAIQKYGIENIKQEILFANIPTKAEADRLESLCILLFKTNCRKFRNPSYGYNLTDGGNAVKDEGDAVVCLENGQSYATASIASYRLFGNRQSSGNIRACCKGRIRHVKGYHFLFQEDYSPENAAAKLSAERKISKRSHSVYCIELGQTFGSATDASKYLLRQYGIRVCPSHISAVCRHQESITKGYHFLFSDEVTEENIKKALNIFPRRHRTVRCVETGVVYRTLKDAAAAYGITGNHIADCCNGKRKTAGGYHWEYEEVV